MLQTGTQQRSNKLFRLACELVRNGRIGKLTQVTVFVPAGLRDGPFKPAPVPDGFHWDYWLGQAPQVDYLKERCHQTFRWWFDYSGGPVTDWGAHHNDIARWAIGLDGPSEIQARALTEPIPGGYTTPSEFEATLTWANGVKQVVKTTVDDSPFGVALKPDGQRNGVRFEGTNGWIWVNRTDDQRQRPGDARHADDRSGRPPRGQRRSHGELLRCRPHAQGSDQPRRSRAPVRHGRTPDRDRAAHRPHVAVGRVEEKFVGEGAKDANAHLARRMRKPYDYGFAD